MKTAIKYNAILFLLLTWAACHDDENPAKIEPVIYGDVLPYIAGINDVNWQTTQQLGIYMLNAADNTPLYGNMPYSASVAGNAFVSTNAKTPFYFPDSGQEVYFTMYAPFTNEVTGGIRSISTADQSNPAAIDLLHAQSADGYSKDKRYVQLEIKHVLPKLQFVITAEQDGETFTPRKVVVKLNHIAIKGSFNVLTGEVTVDTEKATIEMLSHDDAPYQASGFVLPGAAEGVTLELELTLAGKTYSENISSYVAEFKASTLYLFNVRATKAGISIDVDTQVNNWNDGNDEGEDIPLQDEQ